MRGVNAFYAAFFKTRRQLHTLKPFCSRASGPHEPVLWVGQWSGNGRAMVGRWSPSKIGL
eukprot:8213538-Lingulodinium_polyedra.AAC.1